MKTRVFRMAMTDVNVYSTAATFEIRDLKKKNSYVNDGGSQGALVLIIFSMRSAWIFWRNCP